MTMKYYSITQDSKFKTLIGRSGDLSLHAAAQQYAFGKASGSIFEWQYELEFNSDDKKKKDGSDVFTFFKPVLILTSRARAVFDSVAPDSIEDINILSPNSDHSGVLVHTVLESAFNRGLSEFDEYPNGLVVYKVALNALAVQGCDVFRVAESPLSVFVSDKFVDAAKDSGLKGLDFKEVRAV
ncbi:imm11 family protein [Pseudomonas plecoglossicida]|uniref:imm11 family protein n=1 Tax=Pseudomonas plecoglossicida TaxID=70775 RepID=UPI00048C221B|nr:DUF1629 domain-containing protein [Pseudomonas plecoglossicida]GLR36210.1 hypothetical protein GCM10011247_16070 [Pseudomonas plecoglossicida]